MRKTWLAGFLGLQLSAAELLVTPYSNWWMVQNVPGFGAFKVSEGVIITYKGLLEQTNYLKLEVSCQKIEGGAEVKGEMLVPTPQRDGAVSLELGRVHKCVVVVEELQKQNTSTAVQE